MGSKNTLIGMSPTGSGSGSCNIRSYEPGKLVTLQERKLCCDTSKDKHKLKDCQWYDNIGQKPDGASDTWCRTGCPSDRVRVAMNLHTTECWQRGGGGKSQCCVPSFADTIEVENPEIERYRSVLKAWVQDPTCSTSKNIRTNKVRQAANMTSHVDKHSLAIYAQQQSGPDRTSHEMAGLLLIFLVRSRSSDTLEILTTMWNEKVVAKFSHMKMPGFADLLHKVHEYKVEGPEKLADEVICNAEFWDKKAGGSKALLECEVGYCNDNECPDDPPALARRIAFLAEELNNVTFAFPNESHLHAWDKRDGRDYTAQLEDSNGQTYALTITLPPVSLKSSKLIQLSFY